MGIEAGIAIGLDGNIWAIDRVASPIARHKLRRSPLDPILEFNPPASS